MLLSSSELRALLSLTFLDHVGPADIARLLVRYKTAVSVIESVVDWSPKTSSADLQKCNHQADEDLLLAERQQVTIIGMTDERYPELLRQTACPPPVLYVKGSFRQWAVPSLAIVGSRSCTHYGIRLAREFSLGLVQSGLVVVSGLARGIDSAAHAAALDAKGHTVAVLGHGLEWLYPRENRTLADRLIENGALISEFPMKTPPYPGNFPRRNRIIAGITRGVLVIEGKANSGSLITARMAAQEGREVMAVPGLVGSDTSEAPHQLIQNGATLVCSVSDVLNQLSIPKELFRRSPMDSSAQRPAGDSRTIPAHLHSVWSLLSDVPIHREQIASTLKVDVTTLSASLVELELIGQLKQVSGGLFIRA